MSNIGERRWVQRLASLRKALAGLEEACKKAEFTNLERAGLVQMFEFSFELTWKTLKDYLFFVGYSEVTPRGVIRKSFEVELLDEQNAECLLDALIKRNLLSHTYDEVKAKKAEKLIRDKYLPALLLVVGNLELNLS